MAKGSARSIPGFDLFKNLSTCRDLLPHFGGHTMAAGMTLNITDVDELRLRLNQLAQEQLNEEDLIPITYIDTEISLQDIHIEAIEEMNKLAPYGMDNPKPKVLYTKNWLGAKSFKTNIRTWWDIFGWGRIWPRECV